MGRGGWGLADRRRGRAAAAVEGGSRGDQRGAERQLKKRLVHATQSKIAQEAGAEKREKAYILIFILSVEDYSFKILNMDYILIKHHI